MPLSFKNVILTLYLFHLNFLKIFFFDVSIVENVIRTTILFAKMKPNEASIHNA